MANDLLWSEQINVYLSLSKLSLPCFYNQTKNFNFYLFSICFNIEMLKTILYTQ